MTIAQKGLPELACWILCISPTGHFIPRPQSLVEGYGWPQGKKERMHVLKCTHLPKNNLSIRYFNSASLPLRPENSFFIIK
jgi:hypothetical protein